MLSVGLQSAGLFRVVVSRSAVSAHWVDVFCVAVLGGPLCQHVQPAVLTNRSQHAPASSVGVALHGICSSRAAQVRKSGQGACGRYFC